MNVSSTFVYHQYDEWTIEPRHKLVILVINLSRLVEQHLTFPMSVKLQYIYKIDQQECEQKYATKMLLEVQESASSFKHRNFIKRSKKNHDRSNDANQPVSRQKCNQVIFFLLNHELLGQSLSITEQ